MENIIIAIILIVVVGYGIRGSIKRFRGESGCCGGGSSVKPRDKKLKNKILKTYVLKIEGMHCQNCVNKVVGAINDIDGAAAQVDLKKQEAKVSIDREVDIETIKKAVEKQGYHVTDYTSII